MMTNFNNKKKAGILGQLQLILLDVLHTVFTRTSTRTS